MSLGATLNGTIINMLQYHDKRLEEVFGLMHLFCSHLFFKQCFREEVCCK